MSLESFKTTSSIARAISVAHTIGFRTGSTVFGVDTPESDIDIVVTARDWTRLVLMPLGMPLLTGKEISNYGHSGIAIQLRMDESDRWTNIIIVRDELVLLAWKQATRKVLDLIHEDPANLEKVRDRTFRVRIFDDVFATIFRVAGGHYMTDFFNTTKGARQ